MLSLSCVIWHSIFLPLCVASDFVRFSVFSLPYVVYVWLRPVYNVTLKFVSLCLQPKMEDFFIPKWSFEKNNFMCQMPQSPRNGIKTAENLASERVCRPWKLTILPISTAGRPDKFCNIQSIFFLLRHFFYISPQHF